MPPHSPLVLWGRRQVVSALASLAAASVLPVAAQENQTTVIGQSAPDFKLVGRDGEPVSLAGYAGKVVYLDFWASWCGPCRQSFPWMNELHDQLRDKGLHVLAINVDAKHSDAMRFLADTRASFQVAFDPAGVTPRAYGVRAMPTSFLIDRKGAIVATHPGFTLARAPASRRDIEQRLGVV